MVLAHPGKPLLKTSVVTPDPGPGHLLIQVHACAVCRTDLHIVDGELTHAKLPLIPGHEIVGKVAQLGDGVGQFKIGDRVGVPWLGWTCDTCSYCRNGQENLCDHGKFTGYTLDGGYAEYTVADRAFLLANSRRLQRRRSRAAAVRRTDRLSQPGQSRQRQTAWASTASAPPPISSPR